MDRRLIDRSVKKIALPHDPERLVQEEDLEDLALLVPERGSKIIGHSLGATNEILSDHFFTQMPNPEFPDRHEHRYLCGPEPLERLQRIRFLDEKLPKPSELQEK